MTTSDNSADTNQPVENPAGEPAQELRSGWASALNTNFRRLIPAAIVCGVVYSLTGWSRPEPAADAFQMTPEAVEPVDVRLVQPDTGGIPREIVQTGTIEAIERAQIRARISGYLKSINVEIGDVVEEGALLAEIHAPELLRDVDKQAAMVEQAESHVLQAKARVKTIEAKRQALRAAIQQAQADVARNESQYSLKQKQLDRIQELARNGAVEQKLVDENIQKRDSALAGRDSAKAVEAAAQADLLAIDAEVELALADLTASRADVRVATANLARAEVMVNYTHVRAPFSGVITARNYDRGDFLQSASNQSEPLLDMARIDKVRAVVQVPASDVPFVRPGQPAKVRIASLGGHQMQASVSRIAWHQNRRSRTMRVEIDPDNSARLLASGMYGNISIDVPPVDNQLTVPVECLIGRAVNGRARVFLARNNQLELIDVTVGRRTENRIEILSGITEKSEVAIPAGAALTAILDGYPIANNLQADRMVSR